MNRMLIIASYLKLMFWETFFSCPLLGSAFEYFLQYFAFRECIAPWSIGWVFEVVFGGSPSYTAFKPSIIYNINNFTIFFFKLFIEFLYPFIKKETVYPNFHLRPIMTGKYLLYMPFSLYLDRIVGRDFSFHAFVISGETEPSFPSM